MVMIGLIEIYFGLILNLNFKMDAIIPIICFALAGYSVIANDSIQTLGTWMASNRNVKWYWLAIFASTILAGTILYSWGVNAGDISYGRLNKIPYVEVEWYYALAPLILVILTHKGIPVSTSFLILTTFASSIIFEKMLLKSFAGYVLAATIAYLFWFLLSKWLNENRKIDNEKVKTGWRIAQWASTSFLWWTWLSHDIANTAVFLPRALTGYQVTFIILFFVTAIFYIFHKGGGKIQNVVLNKKNTRYVRSATIIDIVYAFLLLFFKEYNDIPMSTTWVFLGLLAGREVAINRRNKGENIKSIMPIIGGDFGRLMIGLAASVVIALIINYMKT